MDAVIAVRFVHFAATLTAGGTIWLACVAPPLPPRLARQFNWLTAGALAVAALTGAAWLALVAANILGGSPLEVCLNGGVASVLADTRFGIVSAMRLLLAVAVAGLLPWPGLQPLQALLALAFVALPALTGHAGAMPGLAGIGAIAADMAHLAAAAAWLGALPALALLLTGEMADAPLVRAVRRYAGLALASVAVLTGSGLVNSWHLLSGPGDLIATDYGRLLALKLALFAAMIAVAAVNRFRLTPGLPAPAARRALKRSALAETALGFGVLILVAALGITPPGGHVHETGGVPPEAEFVHIHDARAMAEVTINPGRAGSANIIIRVMREDMSEFPAGAVRLALDPPREAARSSIEHAAVRDADGIWHIDIVELSVAGIWTARVIVTPMVGSTFVLDAPIVIAP